MDTIAPAKPRIPKSIATQMTGIEWTDFSANLWAGCTAVPASSGGVSGCTICYAETFASQRLGVTWGAGQPRRLIKGFRERMTRLNRLAAETGMPVSVFLFSLADYLDPEVDRAWVDEPIEAYGPERVFFKQHGVFRDGVYVGDKKRAGRDVDGKIFDTTPWPRHRAQLNSAKD